MKYFIAILVSLFCFSSMAAQAKTWTPAQRAHFLNSCQANGHNTAVCNCELPIVQNPGKDYFYAGELRGNPDAYNIYDGGIATHPKCLKFEHSK